MDATTATAPTAGSAPPPPLAVSPAEAARLLGISRAQVYNWIRDGKLRVFHLGRSARIRYADLEHLIADHD